MHLKGLFSLQEALFKEKGGTFFEQSSKIRQRRKTQDEGINSLQTLFVRPLKVHRIRCAYPDDF